MLEQALTVLWLLLILLRQHSFHWFIQYYHADYRAYRTSTQPHQSFIHCGVRLLCLCAITQLPERGAVPFLGIAFHKMCFKASCHAAPNCAPEHYQSFHLHFFAFHSLHLILEALEQPAFWLSCLPEGVSTTMLLPKWLKNQNEKLPEWRKGGREAGKWAKKKMKKKHWGEKLFFNCTTNFVMQVLDLTLIKVIGM